MTLPPPRPMMAVSWDAPFDDDGWAFEPKLDGVRAIAVIDGGRLVLVSRSGRDITDSYPELDPLGALAAGTMLDGEIVAYDPDGRPSFERLQGRIHARGRRAVELATAIPIGYVVFDLLAADGENTVAAPYEGRVARLHALDLPAPTVVSHPVAGSGVALYEAVVAEGMEGIVAKRYGSPYRPGIRSPDWRKIPNVLRIRAVVGGFTPGRGGRLGRFGALQLGLWDGERLRWIGGLGTGFDDGGLQAIRAALDEMRVPTSPFHPDPALPRDTIWVEPHLVAEIAFKQWTAAGRLRAASFQGFSDRPHHTVTWQTEGPDR